MTYVSNNAVLDFISQIEFCKTFVNKLWKFVVQVAVFSSSQLNIHCWLKKTQTGKI